MSPSGVFSRLTQYQSPFTSPGKASPKSESIALALGMTSITEQPPSFNTTVDVIRSEHTNAARASVRNPEILKNLEVEIERDCENIKSFLFATQVCVTWFTRSCVTALICEMSSVALETHWFKPRSSTRSRRGLETALLALENVLVASSSQQSSVIG